MNGKAFFKTVMAVAFIIAQYAPSVAQGFGGLGISVEGFSVPQRGYEFQFPKDHAAHPNYRIEWWYLTANLKGEDGKDYGVQWTLFRSALKSEVKKKPSAEKWSDTQVWMGHAAVTTPDKHFVAETRARGGIGLAGAGEGEQGEPFSAFINDWHLTSRAGLGEDAYSKMEIAASGADFAYQFSLQAQGPLVNHGDNGFSVKSAQGQASYYYSQPFYTLTGTLDLPSGPIKASGTAWLDREWSSQPLSDNQTGWDWISLHLDDGAKLMGFRLRQKDGSYFTSASYIRPDGSITPYSDGALTLTPLETHKVAGREVPVSWRVALPAQGIDLTFKALNKDAWMETSIPYWEGPVRLSGSHEGRGYLEMTGY